MEGADFGGAQAAGVEELHEGAIAEPEGWVLFRNSFRANDLEKLLDLIRGEGVWEFAPTGGLIEQIRGVGWGASLGVKPA